tara:strand:+ start:3907 stop:4212 length:306 start_codon:yes stop_codon:yes gene_type:complete
MESTKQILIQIDETQLKRFINVAVRTAVKEYVDEHINNKIEKTVSAKECALHFGFSNANVMIEKAKRGEIPASRWNGDKSPYRFYLSKVDEVLRNKEINNI